MIKLNSVNSTIVLLALLAGLLSFPLMAPAAEDTDSNGDKLKEILQKSDAPKKLKEGQTVGNMDFETAYGLCALEGATGVGAIIWTARNSMDACKLENMGMSYCVGYSMNCNHYKWNANCLKDKKLCDKIK